MNIRVLKIEILEKTDNEIIGILSIIVDKEEYFIRFLITSEILDSDSKKKFTVWDSIQNKISMWNPKKAFSYNEDNIKKELIQYFKKEK